MGRAARLKKERKLFTDGFTKEMYEQTLAKLKEAGEKEKKYVDEIDDWTALDEAYFAENPDQTSYDRALTPNEKKEVQRFIKLGAAEMKKVYTVKVEKFSDGKIQKFFMTP